MTGAPDLTVVIPSVNGWGDLEPCLRACARLADAEVEIVVVDRVGSELREAVARSFPTVRVLAAAAGTTIPRLRAQGIRAATGRLVGIIEDHVIVPPDWAARMLAAHGDATKVVGGAVENAACDRLTDWAAFLCEYSHCVEPGPPGPADWLVGNNVTYPRAELESFLHILDEQRWENELHDAMRAAGIPLESHPEIRVGHKKHYRPTEYIEQRYLYSRAFAGIRFASAGPAQRLAFGLAAAFLLPPLLSYRIVSRVWRTGRHRRELVRSLPLLVPFVLAWAAGELVGAWFGGGTALTRVC